VWAPNLLEVAFSAIDAVVSNGQMLKVKLGASVRRTALGVLVCFARLLSLSLSLVLDLVLVMCPLLVHLDRLRSLLICILL